MKKLMLITMLVGFLAAPALAAPTVVVADSYGSTNGGEFLVTPSGFPTTPTSLGEVAGEFETFCIEKSETFSFGYAYDVEFNTYAVGGGVGGQDVNLDAVATTYEADSLDVRTAYLYDQFITGTLTGYDYGTGTGRVASANALQEAIWFIEDELGSTVVLANLSVEAQAFYGDAMTNNTGSLGSVLVMNLYTTNSPRVEHQSMLVRIPAPGAVLLGSLGVALVGWLRRRRSL